VLLAAILNFGSLPLSTNVGQRRPTSGSVHSVKSKSGVIENMLAAFGIVSQSITVQKFKSYFQFRFGGRHLESVVINDGQCLQ
jgi:hypothetical protein